MAHRIEEGADDKKIQLQSWKCTFADQVLWRIVCMLESRYLHLRRWAGNSNRKSKSSSRLRGSGAPAMIGLAIDYEAMGVRRCLDDLGEPPTHDRGAELRYVDADERHRVPVGAALKRKQLTRAPGPDLVPLRPRLARVLGVFDHLRRRSRG
ncbi:hypothetical protein K438DRAFT_1778879 [Mycena galopus ATCC 62051]|nr:hypothetical protein K438DRAFT_1778879 [Mycena galopus ATCC 62051]